MTRLPPGLARRVDRLARRAHAFHRWAHHPLCSWYAAEVIRLGRRARLCLGCALTAAGAVLGTALGLAVPVMAGMPMVGVAGLLLALAPLVVGRNNPSRRSSTPIRARKLLTRLLPAAAASFLVAQAARAPSPARLAAAALAAAAVAWVTLRYRRRGPARSACEACPQGPPSARCPGLAPIARRERALSRLAGRWIAGALPVPAPRQEPPTAPPRPWPAAAPCEPPRPPRP